MKIAIPSLILILSSLLLLTGCSSNDTTMQDLGEGFQRGVEGTAEAIGDVADDLTE